MTQSPANYTKEVNSFNVSLYNENKRDEETLAFLGGACFVRKLHIPQPSPGVFALLEIVNSPFLRGELAELITIEDLYIALRIMTEREKAITSKVNLKKMARKIGKLSPDQALTVVKEILELFSFSYKGFELLPKTAGDSDKNERIFDAEWMAGIVSKVHQATRKTDFEIIWRTPLCAIGFHIAQWAKENGTKNIGRQNDNAKLLAHLKKIQEPANNGK